MEEMNLYGEDLRSAIDEAIAEIDRVEEEMLELFAELISPDAAAQLAMFARAQEERSPLRPLMDDERRSSGREVATGQNVIPPAPRGVTTESDGREWGGHPRGDRYRDPY